MEKKRAEYIFKGFLIGTQEQKDEIEESAIGEANPLRRLWFFTKQLEVDEKISVKSVVWTTGEIGEDEKIYLSAKKDGSISSMGGSFYAIVPIDEEKLEDDRYVEEVREAISGLPESRLDENLKAPLAFAFGSMKTKREKNEMKNRLKEKFHSIPGFNPRGISYGESLYEAVLTAVDELSVPLAKEMYEKRDNGSYKEEKACRESFDELVRKVNSSLLD